VVTRDEATAVSKEEEKGDGGGLKDVGAVILRI